MGVGEKTGGEGEARPVLESVLERMCQLLEELRNEMRALTELQRLQLLHEREKRASMVGEAGPQFERGRDQRAGSCVDQLSGVRIPDREADDVRADRLRCECAFGRLLATAEPADVSDLCASLGRYAASLRAERRSALT